MTLIPFLIRNAGGTISAAAIAFLLAYSGALAVTLPQECRFDSQVKELDDRERGSSGDLVSQSTPQLAIRKNLLVSANRCALWEVKNLIQNLNAAQGDSDVSRIKDYFSRQLAAVTTTYTRRNTDIPAIETVRESKDAAKNFLTWRTQNFVPLAEKISRFVAWNNNQSFLTSGHERLSHISRTITDLALHTNPTIKKLLLDAEISLAEADRSNQLAKDVFTNPQLPDDSLKLIRASLEALATAYQKFFDISETVQTIVPHY